MRILRSGCIGLGIVLWTIGTAHAAVVNIDAAVTGCTPCTGSPHPQAGDILSSVISPVQLTLGPGTYTVMNGIGAVGANPNFSAWNFNSSGANWVWDFLIIDDSNRKVLMDSCCGTQIYSTQSAAAQSSHAVNFSQSFTLAQQTTLDFVTEDYYPPDNLGGVALLLTPEPSTALLLTSGLLALGVMRREGV